MTLNFSYLLSFYFCVQANSSQAWFWMPALKMIGTAHSSRDSTINDVIGAVYSCCEETYVFVQLTYEPRRQKIGLRGFQPGPTQSGLDNH